MNGPDLLGVLGGMFDPIHCGHLDAAEAARTALQLDEVLLMPSQVAAHRRAEPQASTYHRFAMVALGITGRAGLLASDFELQRDGPCYTAVTLERLNAAGRDPWKLFFITGADAFAEIATWYDYPALLRRSRFAVVSRPGFPVSALRGHLPELAPYMHDVSMSETGRDKPAQSRAFPSIWLVGATTASASSTEIRSRVASNTSLRDLTPPAVADYIRRHRLYQPRSAGHLHEQS